MAIISSAAAATATILTSSSNFLRFRVQCCSPSSGNSNTGRGFGSKTDNKNKTKKVSRSSDSSSEEKGMALQERKSTAAAPSASQAPGLSSRFGGKSSRNTVDVDFEQRLQAVRRSALEQKKAEEVKEFGTIDYDAPVETEKKTIGLGTKIGVGVAVLVFGLVFALGDFLPSGSDGPTEEATVVNKKLSEEEQSTLRARLKQYESTLSTAPKDPIALEGAAVTLVELGEYNRAVSLLQDLAKEKTSDPDVFRLLGELKYELKDYDGSAAAYRISAAVSKNVNFEVLRGLTNALLAARKPDEAVQVLLASRANLNSEKETESQEVDPIQVDLLLGKAYSDWGHVSDAVSVYDQLISRHPDDFRGYLAKGILLKENGSVGDAERMFIQARFFAPEKAKALVDRYARN
ncbi:unnamed protein product [Dovyalis caffra]|uniref:Tetratricopeptide repeat-like superfamily protein n=1 Tax=Dovyalis caffra TaxID=77055 RepID=A0AAV1QQ90_9ROSI|nr:unnamed protein product [Dovyalis caffra]